VVAARIEAVVLADLRFERSGISNHPTDSWPRFEMTFRARASAFGNALAAEALSCPLTLLLSFSICHRRSHAHSLELCNDNGAQPIGDNIE
jgi:hypothetical protein